MSDAREIKTQDEISLLTHSAAMVDAAYYELYKAMKPGMRENDAVALVAKVLYETGSEYVEGVNAISGERCSPHPHVFSDRMMRPGDPVFYDILHSYMGYRTCYYRCFAIGSASQQLVDAYKRCRDYLDASIELIRPGRSTAEVASVWPKATEFGFPDEEAAFALQMGHGIGLAIWEKPMISRLVSLEHPHEIKPGMVFALETFWPTKRRLERRPHRGRDRRHRDRPRSDHALPGGGAAGRRGAVRHRRRARCRPCARPRRRRTRRSGEMVPRTPRGSRKPRSRALMATSVVMPALEMAQETGKLVAWKKKEGEQVKKGEMLLEVETDKAVVEIEAQTDGMLGGVTAKTGDVVPVGQTIALAAEAGRERAAAGSGDRRPDATWRCGQHAAPAAAAAAPAASEAPSAAGAQHFAQGPPARARARRRYREGQGIGPRRRDSRRRHPPCCRSAAPIAPVAPRRTASHRSPTRCRLLHRPHHGRAHDAELDDRAAFLRDTRRGRVGAQRARARAHSGDRAVARREGDAHRSARGGRGAGAAAAPADERQLDERQHHAQSGCERRAGDGGGQRGRDRGDHATPTGLALGDIAKQRKELAERARANRLQPADISGATFTISNLGMFSVDAFTAIIVPPQAGILAVGAIADRVVAVDG